MTSKPFIFGMIAGAAALAIVERLIIPTQERMDSSDPTPHTTSLDADTENASESQGTVVQTDRHASAVPAATPPTDADADRVPRIDSQQIPESQADTRVVPKRSSESQDTLSKADRDSRTDTRVVERGTDSGANSPTVPAEEPANSSWPYYMEQTLRQFLAGHPNASQFDFVTIACRSTACEIHAVAFAEKAWPIWQQIVFDITQQPWSEFGQTGSSSSPKDGRMSLIATLQRRPQG